MGEQRRWVISVDEETHLLAEQWQADFSPLVGHNRSSLVRLVFKTLNRMGFTAENIMAALAQPQQLRQAKAEQFVAEVNTSSQQFPSAIEESLLGPKPPMRITPPQAGARRRSNTVNHRMASCTVMAVLAEVAAYRPHFLGKLSPFKSNTYERVA